MTVGPIRIVTADDHPIFRDGLRRLLDVDPGFQVVGEAGSGHEAIRLVNELTPDVLLLDYGLPDMSGIDVLRALAPVSSPVKTVLLTAGIDRPEVVEALHLGARGLMIKTSVTALLYKCLRAVAAGEYWFGRDRLPDFVEAIRQFDTPAEPTPMQKLTMRELEIIAAVVNGATNRDVSRQFGLSEQTVKNHLSNIYDKIGVSNRLELALFATHHKLVDRLKRG